jgi:ABC-type nitrate/sulfonate/bicarbonate transport system substrate-binding protein
MSWTRRQFLTATSLTATQVGGRGASPAAQGGDQGLAGTASRRSHAASTWWQGESSSRRKVQPPNFIVRAAAPGGAGLAAGQAMFALGDSNHPLKITEKGKEALMIFATDTRCSYANVVVRKELWDRGVQSVEALADKSLVGRKAVVAATAIGSGTHVYGVYVMKGSKAPDGRTVNDYVEWVGGGASTTMLGGLKAGKFDAIMAVPEWQWATEDEGFGKAIYDVQDEKAWNRVFGGPIPVTVGYTLKETIEKSPDLVQYVNANWRAQQWIHQAGKDEEVVELLRKPYMDAFPAREIICAP